MITRISEVIRGWLGWCPNAGMKDRVFSKTEMFGPNPSASPDRVPGLEEPDGDYRYRHTQPNLAGGKKTTYLLVAGTVIGFVAILVAPVPVLVKPVILVLALLALANALFSSLTVAVSDEILEFWFGAGIWHRKYLIAGIADCRVVRNSWWYGWGIRWTPDGWLYNVAGMDAVEVLFRDGKKLRIGTDEPEILSGAINRALH